MSRCAPAWWLRRCDTSPCTWARLGFQLGKRMALVAKSMRIRCLMTGACAALADGPILVVMVVFALLALRRQRLHHIHLHPPHLPQQLLQLLRCCGVFNGWCCAGRTQTRAWLAAQRGFPPVASRGDAPRLPVLCQSISCQHAAFSAYGYVGRVCGSRLFEAPNICPCVHRFMLSSLQANEPSRAGLGAVL